MQKLYIRGSIKWTFILLFVFYVKPTFSVNNSSIKTTSAFMDTVKLSSYVLMLEQSIMNDSDSILFVAEKVIKSFDSIEVVAPNFKTFYYSQMAKVYYYISDYYSYNGINDSALVFQNKSVFYAQKSNSKIIIANSLFHLAAVKAILGNYHAAINDYFKSYKINWEIKNYLNQAHCINEIAGNYINLSETEIAIRYLKDSYRIFKIYNDKLSMAFCCNNLGYLYEKMGDIPNALNAQIEGLKYREELRDSNGMASSINNLAYIYKNTGNGKKALEYYGRSLEINKRMNKVDGVALAYNNIAYVFLSTYKDTLKAYRFNAMALKLREDIGLKKGVAQSLNNISTLMLSVGDTICDLGTKECILNSLPKVISLLNKSLAIRREISDKSGISKTLVNLAEVSIFREDYHSAYKFALEAYTIASEIKYPDQLQSTSKLLSEIYFKQNKFKEAYEMQLIYKKMSDSLSNINNRKAAIQKSFQYEYDKKAAADSVKTLEERRIFEVQLKQEKTQRFALYGGLILIGVFSIFIFNRFRVTSKQKKIIEVQKQKVDDAYSQLHEKNKEVMDSIRYAARIQRSLITSEKYVSTILNRINTGNGK